ncbi:MAG: hypothetical protein JSW10_07120 [Pseudomonadota bacterium]|nr:MAG: hypothetical protein JSW10_07120 [Pseudomonadota bacterium]
MGMTLARGCQGAGLWCVVLVAMLMLSACGFHLRGAADLPEAMESTFLEGVGLNSDLGRALQQSIRSGGGRVVTRAEDASAVLAVQRNDMRRRVLSVDAQGKANEYELTYTLGFALKDPGGTPLLEPQTIAVVRAFNFDADNALAMSNEEARLAQEMVDSAVAQMLRRVGAATRKAPPASAGVTG